ncbi:MAG: hypothetical protein OEY97_09545 [Nitrospirota bacterium]|nr:hypothetical protein [Nitrospirota bacterium]
MEEVLFLCVGAGSDDLVEPGHQFVEEVPVERRQVQPLPLVLDVLSLRLQFVQADLEPFDLAFRRFRLHPPILESSEVAVDALSGVGHLGFHLLHLRVQVRLLDGQLAVGLLPHPRQ